MTTSTKGRIISAVTAMVTWNPMAAEILQDSNAYNVFDSSKLPGEIQDSLVVHTQTLKDNPDFAKAMTGIWYETMALMSGDDEDAKAAKTAMGVASGTDLAGYEMQLAATEMFYKPEDYIASSTLLSSPTMVPSASSMPIYPGEVAPSPRSP